MEMPKYAAGDIVRLKKQHPCGGYEWKITRVGVDFRLECTTCGRTLLLPRVEITKKIVKIVWTAENQE